MSNRHSYIFLQTSGETIGESGCAASQPNTHTHTHTHTNSHRRKPFTSAGSLLGQRLLGAWVSPNTSGTSWGPLGLSLINDARSCIGLRASSDASIEAARISAHWHRPPQLQHECKWQTWPLSPQPKESKLRIDRDRVRQIDGISNAEWWKSYNRCRVWHLYDGFDRSKKVQNHDAIIQTILPTSHICTTSQHMWYRRKIMKNPHRAKKYWTHLNIHSNSNQYRFIQIIWC